MSNIFRELRKEREYRTRTYRFGWEGKAACDILEDGYSSFIAGFLKKCENRSFSFNTKQMSEYEGTISGFLTALIIGRRVHGFISPPTERALRIRIKNDVLYGADRQHIHRDPSDALTRIILLDGECMTFKRTDQLLMRGLFNEATYLPPPIKKWATTWDMRRIGKEKINPHPLIAYSKLNNYKIHRNYECNSYHADVWEAVYGKKIPQHA